jgi:hypothetical protein
MSIEILNETPINTDQSVINKDGSSLGSVTQATIGTPGGAFIRMEKGTFISNDGINDRILIGRGEGLF